MSVGVAILAAGESRRMGTPKLCLPWKKTTVLGHLIDQWREAGTQEILVVHPQENSSPVVMELDRLGIPPAQRMATVAPERGMMGSVVTAAAWASKDPSLTHLVIALGDQPHLRIETLRDLLETSRAAPGKIVRLVFENKPGHPLALPANLMADLSKTTCATLRDFLGLQHKPVIDLTCRDSGVLLDMDTPGDFARSARLAD